MATQTNPIVIRRRPKATTNVVKLPDKNLLKLIRYKYTPAATSRPRPLLIGVDPGSGGALAVVDMDTGLIIDMIDMPTWEKETKARKQGYFTMIDVHELAFKLDLYAPFTALAILEEPGAMPEQGLSSTFQFGRSCGQVHGVLAGHYIPTATVNPAAWKSALGLSSDKDLSRLRADLEFPAAKDLWIQKQHNDRAEAALLTVYGKKYLNKIIELSRR